MVNDIALKARLDRAIEAAKKAGALTVKMRSTVQVSQKGLNDFVTQADKESEVCIQKLLLDAFPEDGFLGEETGVCGPSEKTGGKAGGTWVVDPIDGTSNYFHGVPCYAVSIAYEREKGCPVLGVVLNPVTGDLFTAVKGCGAELNGQRIEASKCALPAKALVITSPPARVHELVPAYFRTLENVFTQISNIRDFGTAAIEMCYLAAGYCDAFFEYRLQYYDIAAGKIILEEAGGRVSMTNPDNGIAVFLATNGKLHGWFEDALGNPF